MFLFIGVWLGGPSLLQDLLRLPVPPYAPSHWHISCSTFSCSGHGSSGSENTQWSGQKRDTKWDFCFFCFRLLQLCFGNCFSPNIFLLSVNIYRLQISECTFFVVQSTYLKCKGKYDPAVHVGGQFSSWVQKRGEDSGRSIVCFLEGIKISGLMASLASRLRSGFSCSVCSLWTMLRGEGVRAIERGGLFTKGAAHLGLLISYPAKNPIVF